MQSPDPGKSEREGEWVLETGSAQETQGLAARLGALLRAGDVVALVGDLGSGKTTFAQGLAVGLGVPAGRHVASPSFALVSEHPGRVRFVHADFYRVAREAELAELGLEESFDGAACALEWADRFPHMAPADHLLVALTAIEDGRRRLRLRASGPRSRALLAALRGGN